MGIATVLIGCLPTYAQVGILAPILLVVVRVIQGLAFGAEWGGAILMTFEHAPWAKKGRYTAIPQAGFPLGLLLANLAFLASAGLPGDWKWRLPFLLSAILIGAGLYIRLRVEESPEFEKAKEEGELVKNPLAAVIRNDWRNLVRAFSLRIAETAGYAVSITYVTSYLSSNKLATRPETITAIVIAALVGLVATLAWGRLTDRVGRRPVYIIGTSAMLIFGVPMFLMLNTGVFGLIVVTFLISFTICQNSLAGVAGLLVRRAVQHQHPVVRRLAGLPALGRRLRLHRLLGRVALLGLRLDRSRGAVHGLRRHRPHRRSADAGDLRPRPPRRGGRCYQGRRGPGLRLGLTDPVRARADAGPAPNPLHIPRIPRLSRKEPP